MSVIMKDCFVKMLSAHSMFLQLFKKLYLNNYFINIVFKINDKEEKFTESLIKSCCPII